MITTGTSSLFAEITWLHHIFPQRNGITTVQIRPIWLSSQFVFLVWGTQRLLQTIALSNGLSSVASGSVVPTHLFPPGRWKEAKTPRVKKGKLMNLPTAAVGEVVFTDTFKSGDSKFKYGQIYYDYASGWGDISPFVLGLRLASHSKISVVGIGSRYAW